MAREESDPYRGRSIQNETTELMSFMYFCKRHKRSFKEEYGVEANNNEILKAYCGILEPKKRRAK